MTLQSDFRIYRRLLAQARPYWRHLTGMFALRLLGAPLALLTPLPIKIAIDNVIASRPLPGWLAWMLPQAVLDSAAGLIWVVVALIVIFALLVSLQALAVWLLETYTGESLVLDFRAQLFRHVQRLSLSYHDMKGSSDSTYRIQYDAPAIQYIMVNGVIPLVSAFVTLAGMIYVTMRLDRELALVSLGISPILVFITRKYGLSLYQAAHDDIRRLPHFMGRTMLLMDKRPWVRRRALRALAAKPSLFRRLLSVHVGELSLLKFAIPGFLDLGWEILTA